MRPHRLPPVLAVEGSDPGCVAGLLTAGRTVGQRTLVVEEHIRRPAHPCLGTGAQPEVSVLYRNQAFVVAAERIEQVVGEEAGRFQGPQVHGTLEGTDPCPVRIAEAALGDDYSPSPGLDLLHRLLDDVPPD